jgi:IclR family transcriptional regulator, KDG regulon repressor
VNQNSGGPFIDDDISIYMVPAVDRAARILLMLSTNPQGMTLAEIVAATGWHKSSIHKILLTLGHHGFLDRNETTKSYSPGIALVRCGQSALKNLHINELAKSLLKELADFSGETANLAILRGSKMVIVDGVESAGELRVSPPIGTMDSVTAKSIGKAVMAYLPDKTVSEYIKAEGLPSKTKNSVTKLKQYRTELAAVRENGFAIDVEEFQEGANAVSAPVFSSEGQVLGALSIIGPAFRMTKGKMQLYGRKCADAADRLSPLIR